MKVAYFDCFAGASGDMVIGALLDLGVEFEALSRQIASLGLSGYKLKVERVARAGIAASKFTVEMRESGHEKSGAMPPQASRTLPDVLTIIERASLSEQTKKRAIRAFELLAEAEARVHGTTPDRIHFHEVGAMDSIIDTVGAMIGFELLGVERFAASALRVGYGFVDSEHGRLPVPAPATVDLLRGVPVYGGELEGEFVTPTGAAILRSLCDGFGLMPEMKIERVGYGAGSRDPHELPNALRLVLGESEVEQHESIDFRDFDAGRLRDAAQTKVYATPDELTDRTQTKVGATSDETVVVIETNIDDMNPQVYGYVIRQALSLGALDAFVTPVQMKKDRPGALLTVLCRDSVRDRMIDLILRETTTLGVRYYEARRRTLERVIEWVQTAYGPVRVKVARDSGSTLHFQPEYEDCTRLAEQARVPLIEVQDAARAAYRDKLKSARDEAK